ncbi:hypothetical protein [Hydrogenispora ethanolica]|nr:hypothetical protein [Hydrogenispora ethanolica]
MYKFEDDEDYYSLYDKKLINLCKCSQFFDQFEKFSTNSIDNYEYSGD